MKSKRVTCTWEFYRDNCEGFKEPMRKELRKLDDYISNIEAENAKLRELVRIMHGELVSCEDNGYVCGGHKFDERVRELGVEL